ncbi:MAG: AsmA family protein [Acidiferrobacteraceae bacterium]
MITVVAVVLAMLIGSVAIVLAHPDWLRRPIAHIASSLLHRKVEIRGPLRIRWSATPTIQISRLWVANAPWDAAHPMIRIRRVALSLELQPLLHGHIAMPLLVLDQPRILLERNLLGEANWIFGKPHPHKKTRLPAIGKLRIKQGRLRFLEPATHNAVTMQIHTGQRAPYPLIFSGKGSFKGTPINFSGHGGSLLSLASSAPYPLSVQVMIGASHGTARGTITNPQTLSGINLTLSLAGKNMASLYPIIGIPLPATASYSLTGSLRRAGPTWTLSHFTGRAGKSDLSGTLVITTGKPIKVTGRLESNQLNLADLAGFVGAQPTMAGGEEKVERKEAGPGKVLPDRPYQSSLLKAADMNLTYRAKHFESSHLPLDNLSTHIRLQYGVLAFDPLDFGVANGLVSSVVKVRPGVPLRLSVRATLKDLHLSKLLPRLKLPDANTGRLGGHIKIDTQGDSFADFAAHADGHIGLAMAGGTVSNLIVALAQMHFGNALADWLSGVRKEPMRCAVARFGVQNGLLKTRTFVVDTQSTNIFGAGTVNLRTERFNLVLTTKPKHISFLSAREPLYMRGTFKKPSFSISKKKLIERGAAAVVFAIASPAAALLALVDTAPGHHLNCPALLYKAGPKARTEAIRSLDEAPQAHPRK